MNSIRMKLFKVGSLLSLFVASTVIGSVMPSAQASSTPVPPQGYQTNTQYTNSYHNFPNVQASSPTSGGATDNNGVCQGVVSYNQSHGESDLAVDPQNSSHLLGASKFFYRDDQYLFHLGSYVSLDGGASFSNQIIPNYDCATSGNTQQWQNATDPSVTFDGIGGAYTLVLAFNWTSTN